jgi:hypothetical protein
MQESEIRLNEVIFVQMHVPGMFLIPAAEERLIDPVELHGQDRPQRYEAGLAATQTAGERLTEVQAISPGVPAV